MPERPELKKGVDFIGVCVVYICHDGQGNFVMAKRNQNARDEHGRWDIGGGAMEFGSTPEQTLKDEIGQEYKTKVIEARFLGFRDVHRINNDKPTHWIALDYEVLIDPTTVAIGEPDKFDEIGWFTFETIPENTHSQFPKFLEDHREKLSF